MKFKEIKPGMVIHCPKEEDARALLEHLESLGYVWHNGANICAAYSRWHEHCDRTGYQILLGSETRKITNGGVDSYLCSITEFSDLIEPEPDLELEVKDSKSVLKMHGVITSEVLEANKANDLANSLDNQDNDLDNQRDNEMSAVEVLEWLKKNQDNSKILTELFGTMLMSEVIRFYPTDKIIDKIATYEAAKKEKPVELEWIDTCKIIRVDSNGRKVVVHEEVLTSDRHIMETEAILKNMSKNMRADISLPLKRNAVLKENSMTDTEKLISDLKNHRQAYAEGVMKVEHRDITAMSTDDVLDRAIEWIEKGYLDEEVDRTE